MNLLVDIQLKGDCGHLFWWTVTEQLDSEDRGEGAPTLCRRCREQAGGTLASQQSAMVRVQDVHTLQAYQPTLPGPPQFVDREQLLADMREFMTSAIAPIVFRQQTWAEWWKGIDPVASQIAWKMHAARTVDEMVQQRTQLLKHLEEMFAVANDSMLARLDAQIRFLQKQNEIFELQEQLQERQILSGGRLEILQLEQRIRHQRLLKATQPKPQLPPKDPLREAAAEHRQRVLVESEAAQDIYSDYLMAIEAVCVRRIPLNEKAIRVRRVMEAFEMDEDSLPENARRVVQAAERLRDDD